MASRQFEPAPPPPPDSKPPPRPYRPGNGDALSNREAEPGSPEYDYLHRYDSPDNQRDSMG